jgi:hypothetical protein
VRQPSELLLFQPPSSPPLMLPSPSAFSPHSVTLSCALPTTGSHPLPFVHVGDNSSNNPVKTLTRPWPPSPWRRTVAHLLVLRPPPSFLSLPDKLTNLNLRLIAHSRYPVTGRQDPFWLAIGEFVIL